MRGYRVIAAACYANEMVVGRNSTKTHPDYIFDYASDYGVVQASSHHAEFDVLKRLRGVNMSKVRLYVLRFTNSGQMRMAKPCLKCQALLTAHGILAKRVFYTGVQGQWECLSDSHSVCQ